VDSPHASSKIPLEPALRALAERQRRELGPHLEADELVAYRERALAPAETERVRDHLALCPECAGLLLELDAFSEPSPAGAPDLTTGEVEAGWRELAGRLNAARGAAAQGGTVVKIPRPGSLDLLPWALAAALLAGVIGLSLWTESLRQDLHEARRPRGVVDQHLQAEGEETRGEEDPVPRWDQAVNFVLYVVAGQASSSYEVEILEATSNRPLRRVPDPVVDSSGNVHFLLPARSLDHGQYRIVLYPMGKGARHPARYRFTLIGP
jgi:hypothetical protein